MNGPGHAYSAWFGALCLALAAFVYLDNTGSEHAASNPDEYHYLQITRLTAENGHWLPLQGSNVRQRNTKPPGLFWQGIASTNWGEHWELWRLRLPNALFSVLIAAMAFLIARKLAGTFSAGTAAALCYLAFLGVYRHGRVFLTSAPETFWLFLPFCLLLLLAPARVTWGLSAAFGLITGVGLLYKSFAMVIPTAAALGWWALHQREYKIGEWLRSDVPEIALTALLALSVFGLWFVLDPQRQLIFGDFVLKENVGKFDADGPGYLATALWGKHSIWQYGAGWLTNAGLVAPLVAAVFVLAWRGRRQMAASEQLLWIWVITLFVFHLFPNLRYERYLLPAMPAIAVICGIYWTRMPPWVFTLILVAALAASAALLAGALLLAHNLPGFCAYAPADWFLLGLVCAACAAGLVRKAWKRRAALPAVLLVYAAYNVFLRPFDGPAGAFAADAVKSVEGKTVVLPSPFSAREEIYRFLLPGADVRRIKEKNLEEALSDPANRFFILSRGLHSAEEVPGFHTLSRRLNLQEYFTAEQTSDMLHGNVAKHLFAWEILVARDDFAPR